MLYFENIRSTESYFDNETGYIRSSNRREDMYYNPEYADYLDKMYEEYMKGNLQEEIYFDGTIHK